MKFIKAYSFLFAIFINCTSIIAQSKITDLDKDFGIELIKLEEKFTDINQKIELFSYDSPWCKVNGIEKRVLIKELNKIKIGEIKTRENGYLTFVDDLLYKIEICIPENEQNKKSVMIYFTEKYGKGENKTEKTSIWETDKTYLEVKNDSYCTIVTMYSKNLDSKVKLAIKLKEQEIYDSYNKNKKILNKRKDKGNGTFIPDINNTLKLLQKNSSRKNLEMFLPNYTVIDTLSTTFKYNEKTNNHDILDELVSKYTFMYKSKYMVFMEVYTKKGIISKIEYNFDINQDLNILKKQIINNGFNLDTRLSKIISKLGFNNCFVFTKNPSYNFTIYSEKRFSLSK